MCLTVFFYTKLLRGGNNAEQACKEVENWTRKVDVFSKDFILIPINDMSHWSLAIICHPNKIRLPEEDGIIPTSIGYTPCIIHLNSLRDTHTDVVKVLERFLREEWIRKFRTPRELAKKMFNGFRSITPEVPQQTNLTDCGVFLLQYFENFLNEDLSAVSLINNHNNYPTFLNLEWFKPCEVSEKREKIRELIYDLHKESLGNADTEEKESVSDIHSNCEESFSSPKASPDVMFLSQKPKNPEPRDDEEDERFQAETMSNAKGNNVAVSVDTKRITHDKDEMGEEREERLESIGAPAFGGDLDLLRPKKSSPSQSNQNKNGDAMKSKGSLSLSRNCQNSRNPKNDETDAGRGGISTDLGTSSAYGFPLAPYSSIRSEYSPSFYILENKKKGKGEDNEEAKHSWSLDEVLDKVKREEDGKEDFIINSEREDKTTKRRKLDDPNLTELGLAIMDVDTYIGNESKHLTDDQLETQKNLREPDLEVRNTISEPVTQPSSPLLGASTWYATENPESLYEPLLEREDENVDLQVGDPPEDTEENEYIPGDSLQPETCQRKGLGLNDKSSLDTDENESGGASVLRQKALLENKKKETIDSAQESPKFVRRRKWAGDDMDLVSPGKVQKRGTEYLSLDGNERGGETRDEKAGQLDSLEERGGRGRREWKIEGPAEETSRISYGLGSTQKSQQCQDMNTDFQKMENSGKYFGDEFEIVEAGGVGGKEKVCYGNIKNKSSLKGEINVKKGQVSGGSEVQERKTQQNLGWQQNEKEKEKEQRDRVEQGQRKSKRKGTSHVCSDNTPISLDTPEKTKSKKGENDGKWCALPLTMEPGKKFEGSKSHRRLSLPLETTSERSLFEMEGSTRSGKAYKGNNGVDERRQSFETTSGNSLMIFQQKKQNQRRIQSQFDQGMGLGSNNSSEKIRKNEKDSRENRKSNHANVSSNDEEILPDSGIASTRVVQKEDERRKLVTSESFMAKEAEESEFTWRESRSSPEDSEDLEKECSEEKTINDNKSKKEKGGSFSDNYTELQKKYSDKLEFLGGGNVTETQRSRRKSAIDPNSLVIDLSSDNETDAS